MLVRVLATTLHDTELPRPQRCETEDMSAAVFVLAISREEAAALCPPAGEDGEVDSSPPDNGFPPLAACLSATLRYARAVGQLKGGFKTSVVAPCEDRGGTGVRWTAVAKRVGYVELAQRIAAWLSSAAATLPGESALTPATLEAAASAAGQCFPAPVEPHVVVYCPEALHGKCSGKFSSVANAEVVATSSASAITPRLLRAAAQTHALKRIGVVGLPHAPVLGSAATADPRSAKATVLAVGAFPRGDTSDDAVYRWVPADKGVGQRAMAQLCCAVGTAYMDAESAVTVSHALTELQKSLSCATLVNQVHPVCGVAQPTKPYRCVCMCGQSTGETEFLLSLPVGARDVPGQLQLHQLRKPGVVKEYTELQLTALHPRAASRSTMPAPKQCAQDMRVADFVSEVMLPLQGVIFRQRPQSSPSPSPVLTGTSNIARALASRGFTVASPLMPGTGSGGLGPTGARFGPANVRHTVVPGPAPLPFSTARVREGRPLQRRVVPGRVVGIPPSAVVDRDAVLPPGGRRTGDKLPKGAIRATKVTAERRSSMLERATRHFPLLHGSTTLFGDVSDARGVSLVGEIASAKPQTTRTRGGRKVRRVRYGEEEVRVGLLAFATIGFPHHHAHPVLPASRRPRKPDQACVSQGHSSTST